MTSQTALQTSTKNEVAGLNEFSMAEIRAAVAALRAGELVVYPTETFYGIAADSASAVALDKLIAIKGREPDKPIALIASDPATALAIAREVPVQLRRLADAFWPGPLTIVTPPLPGLHPALFGRDGVGIRVSPHPVACALASGLGRPITATSANISGKPPATTLVDARRQLGDRIRVYLDGGALGGGAPSTVVASDGCGVRIIRAGAISEREIMAALVIENVG